MKLNILIFVMRITRVNNDDMNATITVVVEKKDYEKNVEDKLREYRLKASLPGFRPGKVPASLIYKRFAKPILAEEVNNLLSNSLSNYLQEENLTILGDPLPNNGQQKSINWEEDTDFEFVFDIAISPSLEIDLANMQVLNYYKIKVDQKMIEETVEEARMRHGSNAETGIVGERSSVRGDFAQVGSDNEKLEEGINAEDVLIAIDLIKDEAVRNELIGKKTGEVVVFDPVIAFENRHEVSHMLKISHEVADTLAGNFSFTIKSILDFNKAELGEELYRSIYGQETEIKTEEQFRERLAEEIARNLSFSSDKKFSMDARETLLKTVEFELPEEFLKRWLKEIRKEMTGEQVEQEFGDFTRDLRWQLIKNTLIRKYEIKADEEEVKTLARNIALSQFQQYGIFEVKDEFLDNYANKILEKEEDKERIVRKLFEDKVFMMIKNEATIAEQEVSSEEFSALIENNAGTDS